MRSAQTTARGIIMAMKMPIMTAMRICSRYCRKAVSEPICISPASTRWPPNHSTAAVAMCRIMLISGNISTKRLPTFTRHAGELGVGVLEALGLVRFAHEGAHHADAGDLLAQHAVDAVDAVLHLAEERHQEDDQDADDDEQHGHGDPDQPGQARRPRAAP